MHSPYKISSKLEKKTNMKQPKEMYDLRKPSFYFCSNKIITSWKACYAISNYLQQFFSFFSTKYLTRESTKWSQILKKPLIWLVQKFTKFLKRISSKLHTLWKLIHAHYFSSYFMVYKFGTFYKEKFLETKSQTGSSLSK